MLAFEYPAVELGDFEKTRAELAKRGLMIPTTAQNFRLLEVCAKHSGGFCKDIIDAYTYRGLWSSTEEIWCPEEVIIYDNPKGDMPKELFHLGKMYGQGNPAIRIVKHGFKKGPQLLEEFLENPYVQAHIGDREIEESVKVVRKAIHEYNPLVYIENAKYDRTVRHAQITAYADDYNLQLWGNMGNVDWKIAVVGMKIV